MPSPDFPSNRGIGRTHVGIDPPPRSTISGPRLATSIEPGRVTKQPMATSDLLEAWREATRAAELAAKLAALALDAAETADRNAVASEEIAVMAQDAADAAQRAADTARTAAQRASALANTARSERLADAARDVADAQVAATRAGELYHKAEAEAQERQGRKPLDG